MIRRKTTFIVGAGASSDLGLPVGKELQSQIHALLTDGRSADYQDIWDSIRIALGNDATRFDPILKRAPSFLLRMLSAPSIDNFLDQHKDEDDLVITLKCAIVYAIAKAEQNSKIGLARSDMDEIVRKNSDYFLFDLLNLAAKGHQVSNIGQSLSNLTLITFNYDRCIERYIKCFLVYRFGQQAGSLAQLVNVIHVYGSIDKYFESDFENPFERQGITPYLNSIDVVPKLAKRIKLFTEQEDSDLPNQLQNVLHTSDVIGYLGFGFEEQNMRFFPNDYDEKDVFATAFMLSDPNIAFLKKRLGRLSRVKGSVNVINGKCKQLFSEFHMSLASAIGTV